ncbi:MAG: cytochrome c [Acidobacteria bacterium]|nr:cytochrome c [Acidobacteriota bacterium]
MSKRFRSSAVAAVLALAGCGSTSRRPPIEIFPDMDRQPKIKAQTTTLRPVPGTVAQGQLQEDESRTTGIASGMYIGRNPLPLNRETLSRGRERFDIYCAPCHDRLGSGHGIVAQRSSWLPANMHDARVKNMTDGELFSVATHGRRSMPAYRFQVSESDRWAIVAYVRALQRTTSATLEDVPAELRRDLR